MAMLFHEEFQGAFEISHMMDVIHTLKGEAL